MRSLVLALVLFASLAACAHTQNKAVTLAGALADDVSCIRMRTGEVGKPDTAICETSLVVLFCRAGTGQRDCNVMNNFNPKKDKEKEQPQSQPAPAASSPVPTTPSAAVAPTPTPSVDTTAKPAEPKPADKADPPKKVEPKK